MNESSSAIKFILVTMYLLPFMII